MGKNILQAVDAAAGHLRPPTISTGICPRAAPRPHRYASFALVHGNDTATLYTIEEYEAA